MSNRPDEYPDWATQEQIDAVSNKPNRDPAPFAKRESGWARAEVPSRQWWNWLHWLTARWTRYLDDTVTPTLTVSAATFVGADGFVVDVDIERFGYATGQGNMILLIQYREAGVTAWSDSDIQTVSDIGSVEFSVFGLNADTAYEYRAALRDPLNPSYQAQSNQESVITDSEAVLRPTIIEPPANTTFVFEDQAFESSAFAVAGADTHIASQWQFFDADGVYFDSGEDTSNLESYQLPLGTMPPDTLQSVRVRHKGSSLGWSPWSQESIFTSANAFNFLYGGNETGLFVRIDPASITGVDNADTQDAQCTAITSAGEFLYAGVGNNVYKIDRRTLDVVGTFVGGAEANGLAEDSGFLYIAGNDQFIRKIDTDTMTQVNTHNALTAVYGVAAGGGFVYYSKGIGGVIDGQAAKLDPADMSVLASFDTQYIGPNNPSDPISGSGDEIAYANGFLIVGSRGFLAGSFSAIWKVDPTDMSELDVYDWPDGSNKTINHRDGDDFFYAGQETIATSGVNPKVFKINVDTFELESTTAENSANVIDVSVGIDHIYASLTDGNVRRYRKSNMAQVGSYAATQSPLRAIHYR